LDEGALGNDNSNVFSNSSVFYFEDPRNVFMAPLTGATWDAMWNVYTVDTTQSYGRIIVHWCDSSPALDCQDRGQRSTWRQTGNGPGTFGLVRGLTLRDLTECPGACNSDVLEADHSNDGEHNSLGGNALAGHDYEVTYVDAAWAALPSADLAPNTAMEIHWRYAPVGVTVTVRIPVPSIAQTVTLLRGERTVAEEPLGAPLLVGPPASALEWSYDAATSKVWLRLDAQTDAAIDRANAAVLMLF
jgi:hypothetical protein